eukprot:1894959-Prymnesium_polylepis.1
MKATGARSTRERMPRPCLRAGRLTRGGGRVHSIIEEPATAEKREESTVEAAAWASAPEICRSQTSRSGATQ